PRSPLVVMVTRHGIPTSFPNRDFVVSGGLMSYGTDWSNSARQAGIYIARILKGEKPADLPGMQPTKFQLTLNLNTANPLGLDIPQKLLALAEEVMEGWEARLCTAAPSSRSLVAPRRRRGRWRRGRSRTGACGGSAGSTAGLLKMIQTRQPN